MSFTSPKRGRDADPTPSKRTRTGAENLARLCDLRAGSDLFSSATNAARAKERGILRNREASSKYEEVQRAPLRSRSRTHRSCAPLLVVLSVRE